MPVNGLLLTLSSDPGQAAEALAQIDTRDGIDKGERQNRWLPVATESTDPGSARDLHAWLESLPGVEQVEVVYVAFDEPAHAT